MPRAQIKDEDMSKADLMKRARQVGIKGRSSMSKGELIKGELIKALRSQTPGRAPGQASRVDHVSIAGRWRWSLEFANHTGRPADWAPPGQHVRRGS